MLSTNVTSTTNITSFTATASIASLGEYADLCDYPHDAEFTSAQIVENLLSIIASFGAHIELDSNPDDSDPEYSIITVTFTLPADVDRNVNVSRVMSWHTSIPLALDIEHGNDHLINMFHGCLNNSYSDACLIYEIESDICHKLMKLIDRYENREVNIDAAMVAALEYFRIPIVEAIETDSSFDF